MRHLLPVLLFCLMTACGAPTVLDVGRYSQQCSVASDCEVVITGDLCLPCSCANTAIATSSDAKYQSDAKAARIVCGPTPAVACSSFAACVTRAAACTAGRCVTVP